MRIGAIVLAAGEGRRIGGPKALLRIGDSTFLERCCRLFREAGLSVVAVLGAEAERVSRASRLPDGVELVVNDDWPSGMLSSVWRGLDAVERQGADALLLHPVDHPLVAPVTITRIVAALQAGAAITVPAWEGRRGHPGGFARAVFPEIRSAPPEQGARAVLLSRPERVVEVPGDPGCRRGIDLPEQYRQLVQERGR